MQRTPKLRIALVAIPFLLLFSSFIHSDSDFFNKVQDRLSRYYVKYSLEKVYIHTDRDIYSPGDDLWFKAYVRDYSTNKISDRSGTLKLVLVSPDGETPIEKNVLLDEKAQSDGAMELTDVFLPGDYELYAYTSWMQYYPQVPAFKKKIRIASPGNYRVVQKAEVNQSRLVPGESIEVTLGLNRSRYKENQIQFAFLKGEEEVIQSRAAVKKGLTKLKFKLPEEISVDSRLVVKGVDNQGFAFSEEVELPLLRPIDLQFFPEGGDLVFGLSNNVAFKAIDKAGQPVDIEGEILDSNGNSVAQIKSTHKGMGVFEIGVQDENYSVKITRSSKTILDTEFYLPRVKKSGFALNTESDGKLINVHINATNDLVGKEFFITLVQDGRLLQGISHSFGEKAQIDLQFSAESARTGIAKVSLFDNNKVLRNERLIFMEHGSAKAEVTLDKAKYKMRSKVNVDFSVDEFAEASFNVYHNQYALNTHNTIVSQFLLNSELKGDITDPASYFDVTNENRLDQLDLIMMTHGWRSYDWESVFSPNQWRIESDNDYGKWVVVNKSGRPLKNRKLIGVSLLTGVTYEIETNEEGEFLHENIDDILKLFSSRGAPGINAVAEPVLRPIMDDAQHYEDEVKRMSVTASIQQGGKSSITRTRKIKDLTKEGNYYELPSVTVEDRKLYDLETMREFVLPDRYLDVIENKMVKTMFNTELKRAPDLVSALRRVNPSIRFNNINPEDATEVYSSRTDSFLQEYSSADRTVADITPRKDTDKTDENVLYSRAILFVVNEYLPTSNFSLVNSYLQSTSNIVSITYGDGIFGKTLNTSAENGIFYIYTVDHFKRKKFDVFTDSEAGIIPEKEFYKPKYEGRTFERVSDARKTLHWEPNLTLKPGSNTLDFYTNNVPGDYVVELEGITNSGAPFYTRKFLKIVK